MVTQIMTVKSDPISYFIQGLIETIGLEEFEKLAHSIVKPGGKNIKTIDPVRQRMDQVYGPDSARGIAICAGRAAFAHLLRQQENELGFTSESFRFAPGKVKLKKGLVLLSKWMSSHFAEVVEVESKDKFWLFSITPKQKEQPSEVTSNLCDFKLGLLQGFLAWASGGKYFAIHEVACCCSGAEKCCYRIEKTPIE
jgi:predicted hydrocarbon binding protein